ncbi:hypothetical protein HPB51_026122 [Rhipicephalus microplus]|uniref:Uncharacterized protein n=1 Tax=Rhipicephalus microplus TaxID=6941 RepID=A0A9J6F8Z6_RHIMP|nr:hypothetical protein HPB51_026122 [Rhipicephalus microplus]
MNPDGRNRLTEFSRNFNGSSMYASYVTAWNRVVSYGRLTFLPPRDGARTGILRSKTTYRAKYERVLCYEGSSSGPQGGSRSMDRQVTAIRNFFRRLFSRNNDVTAPAERNADDAESVAGGVANHANAASKHDEQLGDHKDPRDDHKKQVARPTQLKSPFTHSLKCGKF